MFLSVVDSVCRHSFDVGAVSRPLLSLFKDFTTSSNAFSNLSLSLSQPVKSAAKRDLADAFLHGFQHDQIFADRHRDPGLAQLVKEIDEHRPRPWA